MIPFTSSEIRQQVKDAIAPVCSHADNSEIDSLIVGALNSLSVRATLINSLFLVLFSRKKWVGRSEINKKIIIIKK